jgi:hypothetical protein
VSTVVGIGHVGGLGGVRAAAAAPAMGGDTPPLEENLTMVAVIPLTFSSVKSTDSDEWLLLSVRQTIPEK